MAKLVKLFLIFGPVQGSIKVIKKYANTGQTIDESLMSTLCLPKIDLLDKPKPPRFQTFLVTKEDGQVLYGSGLIVYDHEPPPYPPGGGARYASFCYTIITDTPFIHATRSLLQLIWEKKCDDIIVKSIMNISIPARRKCLRIVTPPINTNHFHQQQQQSQINTNLVSNNNNHHFQQSDNTPEVNNKSKQLTISASSQLGQHTRTTIDDIYLYRGVTDLPILDYPLRELFCFLHIDDFLLAYACILMEFRTLIISKDNYKLMIVGETLTSLLLPLKWCNVYVPILPPVYGATYLDAPTSYIMGINTQVTELPENLNHIQCRIYCDESRVVCDADSLALPLFLNDLKKDILKITNEFQLAHETRPITYLDDLKFNRAICILFIKTIRKNILANYERYIVDVPESSADIRQFDVVSYLSDQPEFMRSFLSKFLDTQLFASFVDENAKRIQQSWLSVFDMDPDELSEHFSDKSLELAFENAHRIHLMDLRQEHPNIEIKTVPASPMKLRRRMPALSALANRLAFSKSSSKSIAFDNFDGPTDESRKQQVPSPSPPPKGVHRNSVATISLKNPISLNPDLNSLGRFPNSIHQAPTSLRPSAALSHGNNSQQQPVPNGKIVELINQVKDLTKRILIDKMDDSAGLLTEDTTVAKAKLFNDSNCANNLLIGELCDLIERVWSHGAFTDHQGNSACCPLWNHLVAFARLKQLDSRRSIRHNEFADGSHLNVLSPKSESTELDFLQTSNSPKNKFGNFNWFKSYNSKYKQIELAARELMEDVRKIITFRDVKTDVGKARAFIRLSLERKKLSKNLKTLIGDQTLLNSLYKPYAFLRCEDEREQFLMYLLTLNAVDLPCFTTTFVSVMNTRRTLSNKSVEK